MVHENNCPMLQSSTKQIFLSKINPDNMPQTLLACVFLAGVVSAVLIVFVLSFLGDLSYSLFNIRMEIKKTNNENLHFGTSMIWRGRQKTALNQGKVSIYYLLVCDLSSNCHNVLLVLT